MVRGWLCKQLSERCGRQENDAGGPVVSTIRPEQRHGFPSGGRRVALAKSPWELGRGTRQRRGGRNGTCI